MRVVEKRIEDLRPYKNNPRKNEAAVDKVAASIKEFGFKVPLVITQDGEIVAGHTRLKAAEQLGMKKIPCIIADDLTPEQIKAFRLADNKTAEFSSWDADLLAMELEAFSEIDMSVFGFDNLEEQESPDNIEEDNFNEKKTRKHNAGHGSILRQAEKVRPASDDETGQAGRSSDDKQQQERRCGPGFLRRERDHNDRCGTIRTQGVSDGEGSAIR